MPSDRVYAIGDIHGHLDKLKQVHDWIDADQRKSGAAPVVHLGDLVDRGPNSRGVIDYLIDGIEAGEDWVALKGNHDRMMSLWLEPEPKRDHRLRAEYDWLHPRLGGHETLESYGLDPSGSAKTNWLRARRGVTLESYGIDPTAPPDNLHQMARIVVPDLHQRFLRDLPLMYRSPHVAIVHAGIKPGVALEDQVEDDLIWIRDPFHLSNADHGALIIHGHTPVDQVFHYGNRVNLDTGAAYGGPLSALVIEGREVWQITKRGRKKLDPPSRWQA